MLGQNKKQRRRWISSKKDRKTSVSRQMKKKIAENQKPQLEFKLIFDLAMLLAYEHLAFYLYSSTATSTFSIWRRYIWTCVCRLRAESVLLFCFWMTASSFHDFVQKQRCVSFIFLRVLTNSVQSEDMILNWICKFLWDESEESTALAENT